MLIKLRTYVHAPEARLALAHLEQEGITGMLRNETIHGILPVQALAIQLWIHEEDEAQAREILDTDIAPDDHGEDDFREIDHPEIAYLRKQKKRKEWMPWLWIWIVVLILLLIIFGW
ncbi:MAG: DUF2007 domain-containing protein [Saprospiraceae bacterium]|nr:DUF2007 domain-containing protein [Saprospiraceae bacterium]